MFMQIGFHEGIKMRFRLLKYADQVCIFNHDVLYSFDGGENSSYATVHWVLGIKWAQLTVQNSCNR